MVWTAGFLVSRSLHVLSMRYDADRRRGSRFPEAKTPDRSSRLRRNLYGVRLPLQPLQPAAADALDRVAGMIKKTVYRSSMRLVRGEDDKILGSGTLRCQNGGETCRDRSVLSRSTRPGIHSRNPVNSRVHLTAGAVLGVITYPALRGGADSETYHWHASMVEAQG